jgi:hypothetical protein
MFPLPNVMHFFAHEFSGLRRCGFALPPVTPGPFESLFFWHTFMIWFVTVYFH